jgi:hypothetical protein
MSDESDKFTWDELDLIRCFLSDNKGHFTEYSAECGEDENVVEDILTKLWEAMADLV